jgi:hypothetical protein
MADWATRSAAAGVIRAIHFDDVSKVGSRIWAYDVPGGWGWDWNQIGKVSNGTAPGTHKPEMDLTQGCTTAGALKFTIDSPSSGNAGGTWLLRFSDDRSTPTTLNCVGPAGEGAPIQEFWTQSRHKWSPEFWDTIFLNSDGGNQGGIKVFDFSTGWPPVMSGNSSNMSVVWQTYYQTKLMQAYYYGDTATYTGNYAMRDEGYIFQNQQPAPYCDYRTGFQNCWYVPRNEWFTIKTRYKALSRVTNYAINFECDFWVQNDGGPEILLHSWSPSSSGFGPQQCYSPTALGTTYGEMIGTFSVFPYLTDKNVNQTYSPGAVWCDEIIISTANIAAADATTANVQDGGHPMRLRVR